MQGSSTSAHVQDWQPIPITHFSVETTQGVQLAIILARFITILRPQNQQNVVGDAFLYGLEKGLQVQRDIAIQRLQANQQFLQANPNLPPPPR